jgi:alpha-L-fucosidase
MWEPNYNQGRNSENINPNFPRYVEEYLKPQLAELLTNYGDLGVMWFDGEWVPAYTTEMGKDIYQFVRELQPNILINNRVDKGRKGMEGLDAEGNYAGDFGTPEQEIPATGISGVDWESCMTMNNSWGFKSFDDNWKSDTALIRNLIDIVSKGGNFLLNVGPTAEGLIPAASVERLAAMGEWMEVNSEAIYGAEASPYDRPEWGRFTQRDQTIYAHVFDWPADGKLTIEELSQASKVTLLASGKVLSTSGAYEGTIIELPAEAPDGIATVVKIER